MNLLYIDSNGEIDFFLYIKTFTLGAHRDTANTALGSDLLPSRSCPARLGLFQTVLLV